MIIVITVIRRIVQWSRSRSIKCVCERKTERGESECVCIYVFLSCGLSFLFWSSAKIDTDVDTTYTHTHTRCTAVNRRSLTLSDVAFSPGRKHAHLFTFPTTPTATVLLQDHRNTHKRIHTEIPHNKSHFIGRETQQNTHTHTSKHIIVSACLFQKYREGRTRFGSCWLVKCSKSG